jgi:ketosteroid isomerase-like protein
MPKSLYDLPRTLFGSHIAFARQRTRTKSLEDRLAVLELESAARNLLNQYAYCYDGGDLDRLMDIYADDCVVVNKHGTFAGVAAIRANYERAINDCDISFHGLSNVEVSPSEDRASAWVVGYLYNLAVRKNEPTGTMASFVFHIARQAAGGWKVTESRIVISNQHSFAPRVTPSGISPPPTNPSTADDLIDSVRQARTL